MDNKTLVIILGETRTFELTYDNFKMNVLDELNADLCICIGVKSNYNYDNPFYNNAKYKFIYEELDDYGKSFDYVYDIVTKDKSIYDEGTNKIRLHWREFLKIKDQLLGGINDDNNPQTGSGSILIFYRWFLLYNLIKNDIINKYDKFIITRSDFIYQLPHPKMFLFKNEYIYIPNGEHYGGLTDRHVILSKNNIIQYLDILNCFILKSNDYYDKMKQFNHWNIERLIMFHLQQHNIFHLVKEMPYIMYAVRNKNGTSRWSLGEYNNKLGYYIKYQSEYELSSMYKNKYLNSNSNIDDFYKILIS